MIYLRWTVILLHGLRANTAGVKLPCKIAQYMQSTVFLFMCHLFCFNYPEIPKFQPKSWTFQSGTYMIYIYQAVAQLIKWLAFSPAAKSGNDECFFIICTVHSICYISFPRVCTQYKEWPWNVPLNITILCDIAINIWCAPCMCRLFKKSDDVVNQINLQKMHTMCGKQCKYYAKQAQYWQNGRFFRINICYTRDSTLSVDTFWN